jgi:hypothetical protein
VKRKRSLLCSRLMWCLPNQRPLWTTSEADSRRIRSIAVVEATWCQSLTAWSWEQLTVPRPHQGYRTVATAD